MKKSYTPTRILVIRFSAVGDILITSPLLRSLRKSYPQAEVDMLVKSPYAVLMDGFPELNQRWYYPSNRNAQRKLLKDLTNRRYDTIIDLQNNFRSRTLVNKLSPQRLFRYNRPRFYRFIRINFPQLRPKLPAIKPIAIGYLDCADPLNLQDDGKGLSFGINETWDNEANHLLNEFPEVSSIDKGYFTIAPGAAHATKIWLEEYWVELLNIAFQFGWTKQMIIGGKDEVILSNNIALSAQNPCINLAGRTDLGVTASLIKRSKILISGDTGMMHLSAALATPHVAIFGPTIQEFGFAPFRSDHFIAEIPDLDCRPCTAHGGSSCPKKHFKCMRDLTPQMLWEGITTFTKSRGINP